MYFNWSGHTLTDACDVCEAGCTGTLLTLETKAKMMVQANAANSNGLFWQEQNMAGDEEQLG